MPPRQGLDWERDGANWPLRQHSRFVQTPRLRWHVQYAPHADAQAPSVLLLHGTGASTHSWRDVFPLLAAQCSVLALGAASSAPLGGALRRGPRAQGPHVSHGRIPDELRPAVRQHVGQQHRLVVAAHRNLRRSTAPHQAPALTRGGRWRASRGA